MGSTATNSRPGLRGLSEHEVAQLGGEGCGVGGGSCAFGHDAGDGLTAAGDYDLFAGDDLIDDGRQVRLGFGKGERTHGGTLVTI